MFTHRSFQSSFVAVVRGAVAFTLFAACSFSALRPAWSQPNLSPAAKDTVVAKIGDQPITRGEVDVLIRQALKGRALGADALAVLQAQALSQAIDRRLIEAYLQREGQVLSEKEVDNEMDGLKADVKSKNRTWEQFLANTGMEEPELRREVAWGRNWNRYLSRKIRDEQRRRGRHHERRPNPFDDRLAREKHPKRLADRS